MFAGEKVQPSLQLTQVADSEEPKTIVEKKADLFEDEVHTKQISPLTILSEDEGYLLKDEQLIAEAEPSVEACGEFLISKIKTVKSHKKKKKAVTSYWRPKTRPTNKLRWSMKKILNPKLDSKQKTVVIDTTSSEETAGGKIDIKNKGKSVVRPSSPQPAVLEKLSQSAKETSQPVSKLSEIIVEIKDRLIKQQEEEKAKACTLENQKWDEEDEAILRQTGIIEESIISVDFS